MPREEDQLTSEQAGDPYQTAFRGPGEAPVPTAMGADVTEDEVAPSRFERENAAEMSWFERTIVPVSQEFSRRWRDASSAGPFNVGGIGVELHSPEESAENLWDALRKLKQVGPLLLQIMQATNPDQVELGAETLGMVTRAVNDREAERRVAAGPEEVAEDTDFFNWAAWTDASFVADDASPMEGDVITADSGETIPRSARNLNPFNITEAGNYVWTEDGETFGQIGDDGVFARFDSGARGFRAGFENSSSYDERPNRKVPNSQHDNFSITESHDDDFITLPDGMETMVQWFDVHAPEWKEVNGRKVYENHTRDYYGDFKRTAIALGVEWDELDSRDPQQQLVLALVVASVEADQAFPFTKKALLDGMQHAKTRRSGRNEPQFKAVYIEELRDDKNFKIDRVDGRVMVTLYGRTTEITNVGTPRGPNWTSAYTEDNPHPVPRVAA